MYDKFIKRTIDFTVAFVALVLISPLFLFLIIFLSIVNKGKPFFVQQRTGKNGKLFKIIKFKTMSDRTDSNDVLLPDSERQTRVGSFVRKTSLDEIPQLLNVILGEMSLIGPRPLLPEYLPFYSAYQNRRHEVKPGITGWAQVNGRNSVTWEKKFDLDVWYVENLTFRLDLKIIFLTFKKVVVSDGISPEGFVTMPRFDDLKKNNIKENE
ncbi:sugar transferase [Flavobacterium qiangtangense]|uniref:Sugar transferase n=1 Tax=Flavobacterium qiangtangense TaxID=1442595 RepID=A0ABW1PS42_9FLAO